MQRTTKTYRVKKKRPSDVMVSMTLVVLLVCGLLCAFAFYRMRNTTANNPVGIVVDDTKQKVDSQSTVRPSSKAETKAVVANGSNSDQREIVSFDPKRDGVEKLDPIDNKARESMPSDAKIVNTSISLDDDFIAQLHRIKTDKPFTEGMVEFKATRLDEYDALIEAKAIWETRVGFLATYLKKSPKVITVLDPVVNAAANVRAVSLSGLTIDSGIATLDVSWHQLPDGSLNSFWAQIDDLVDRSDVEQVKLCILAHVLYGDAVSSRIVFKKVSRHIGDAAQSVEVFMKRLERHVIRSLCDRLNSGQCDRDKADAYLKYVQALVNLPGNETSKALIPSNPITSARQNQTSVVPDRATINPQQGGRKESIPILISGNVTSLLCDGITNADKYGLRVVGQNVITGGLPEKINSIQIKIVPQKSLGNITYVVGAIKVMVDFDRAIIVTQGSTGGIPIILLPRTDNTLKIMKGQRGFEVIVNTEPPISSNASGRFGKTLRIEHSDACDVSYIEITAE